MIIEKKSKKFIDEFFKFHIIFRFFEQNKGI